MNQRIHFVVLILKLSFNLLGAIIKYQKYSESGEALHKIGDVLRYPKDQVARFKMD